MMRWSFFAIREEGSGSEVPYWRLAYRMPDHQPDEPPTIAPFIVQAESSEQAEGVFRRDYGLPPDGAIQSRCIVEDETTFTGR
jgi:hypothetical protein